MVSVTGVTRRSDHLDMHDARDGLHCLSNLGGETPGMIRFGEDDPVVVRRVPGGIPDASREEARRGRPTEAELFHELDALYGTSTSRMYSSPEALKLLTDASRSRA